MYPLLVACKSQSPSRRAAAMAVVDAVRQHSATLVEQAQLVSQVRDVNFARPTPCSDWPCSVLLLCGLLLSPPAFLAAAAVAAAAAASLSQPPTSGAAPASCHCRS